jgi:hypothetical protein
MVAGTVFRARAYGAAPLPACRSYDIKQFLTTCIQIVCISIGLVWQVAYRLEADILHAAGKSLLRSQVTVIRLSALPCGISGMMHRGTAPRREGRRSMLWLIWIALMLLTPVLAGIRVWLQLRGETSSDTVVDSQPVP